MNPLTNVKNITKLNEIELSKGLVDKKSWHHLYKDSAWIFIGGLAYGMTEGDILAVFSQYGEIVNINLVRDKKTGKTKGFCFLCYVNQKSTVLAVDNFNGIKLCGRTLRVDHVSNYKPPKDNENDDDITKQLKAEGCAPMPIKLEASPIPTAEIIPKKKIKKEKKKHKKNKKKDDDKYHHKKVKVKKEKHDRGYEKYEVDPTNQESSAKRRKVSENEPSSGETSSSDSDDQEVNKLRCKKEIEYDLLNKHYDQPGTSGFKESTRTKFDKRDSGKNYTSKDRTHSAHHHSKHDSSSSNETSKVNSISSSRKTEYSRKAYLDERQISSDSYVKERGRQGDSSSDDVSHQRNSKVSEKFNSIRKHSHQYSNDKFYKNSKYKDISDSESKRNLRDFSRRERELHSEEEREKYSKSSSSKEHRKHKKDRREK